MKFSRACYILYLIGYEWAIRILALQCQFNTLPTKIYKSSSGLRRSYNHRNSVIHSKQISDEHVDRSKSISKTTTVQSFIQNILNCSKSLSLKSFNLYGPKASHKQSSSNQEDPLRGCIREVQGRLIKLRKKQNSRNINQDEEYYLQVTFKFHGATDIVKNWRILQEAEKELENLLIVGKRSLSTSVIQSEWGNMSQHTNFTFHSAKLITFQGTWILTWTSPNQLNPKCTYIPPTNLSTQDMKNPSLDHDQRKNVLISSSEVFLQKLGVVDVDGKPKIGMASKLRQCQRFIEIMGTLIESSSIGSNNSVNSSKTLTIVDMGCGRGYLTFALHTYLTNHHTFNNAQIITRGVDIRPKLVAEVNDIALSLGRSYSGLQFIQGTIDSLHTNYHELLSPLDILVALHACDTATDDAIWFGIQRSAALIVTAPCCHKEVRIQLDPFISSQMEHPMRDILRHGIYRERMSEMITDSLRALLIEYSHYDVQVFEFVGGEHTSKNVMITAKKRKVERNAHELEILRERITSLVSLYGIRSHHLADRMGIPLKDDPSSILNTDDITTKYQIRDAKNMPPMFM